MPVNMEKPLWVVVPTRNPGPLWPEWVDAIQRQTLRASVLVVDSSSDDGTDFSQLPDNFKYLKIATADFNHGGTRNLAIQTVGDVNSIIVFMTQDAIPADASSLQQLIDSFEDPDVACAYGRQIPHRDANPIAAHARHFNYPANSKIAQLDHKEQLGLKACFMSNSFAAYRVQDLMEAGGFPCKVILGEDMFAGARLLLAGKKIAYAAGATVYHSHNYSVTEEFRRYFDTGVFHVHNHWLLATFGKPQSEGARFLRSEVRYLFKNAPAWLPKAGLHTIAKWAGYQLGKWEAKLPNWLKRKCSMQPNFWASNV